MANSVRQATKRFQFYAENHDAFTDDARDLAKVRALNPDLAPSKHGSATTATSSNPRKTDVLNGLAGSVQDRPTDRRQSTDLHSSVRKAVHRFAPSHGTATEQLGFPRSVDSPPPRAEPR